VSALILASKSPIRASMLRAAGLDVEIRPADVDERAVEAPAVARGETPAAVARLLAEAKALAASGAAPGRLVVGADQTLGCDGQRFTKPVDRATAAAQLRALRGRTHSLASGAALVRDGALLWSGVGEARLTMRDFSDAFLDDYLDRLGPAVTTTVGGYQLEGLGVQLFARVEGDHFTILGLPLLALLDALRAHGALRA
jgi:septum formation protein